MLDPFCFLGLPRFVAEGEGTTLVLLSMPPPTSRVGLTKCCLNDSTDTVHPVNRALPKPYDMLLPLVFFGMNRAVKVVRKAVCVYRPVPEVQVRENVRRRFRYFAHKK